MWPGPTVFPDWFHSNTQGYWNEEFANFFDADTGVDIDALWIDMNEPSNFCEYPCTNPQVASVKVASGIEGVVAISEQSSATRKVREEDELSQGPARKKARRLSPSSEAHSHEIVQRQETGSKKGLPGRDLINPPYKINNANGILPMRTADTNLIHQGGWTEYDTHNLSVHELN